MVDSESFVATDRVRETLISRGRDSHGGVDDRCIRTTSFSAITGNGGSAAKSTFNAIHNVATSSEDHIYIVDHWNICLRSLRLSASNGTATLLALLAGVGRADPRCPWDERFTVEFAIHR